MEKQHDESKGNYIIKEGKQHRDSENNNTNGKKQHDESKGNYIIKEGKQHRHRENNNTNGKTTRRK